MLIVSRSLVLSVKGNVRTLDIAPLHETPPQKRSGMACVLKGSHSFTYTSAIGISHAFAFSAIAGTRLPTLEG